MATYRLMDGVSGRPGVGSSGTQPPSAGTSYSGSYLAGLVFNVSTGNVWFTGYYWWVPTTVSQTGAQKFALWQVTGNLSGALVPNSVVISGTLTAGAWNFVALPTPLLLSASIPYVAATGYTSTSGFPDTQHQFGSGNPYASGITNGPLNALVASQWLAYIPQSPFSTSNSDPSLLIPTLNDADDILWLDVQVSTTAPAGTIHWRAWPSQPGAWPVVVTSNDTTGYTLGLQFSVTSSCILQKIWHYSVPSLNAYLPTRCLIWDMGTQLAVPGTDNQSPTWLNTSGGSASPGAGWVYCDYSGSGIILSSSKNYKVSTFHAGGSGLTWFGATPNVFGVGNMLPTGVTQGPLVIPGNATASPGQQSWNTSVFGYPNTSSSSEADWIDVEVIQAVSSSGLLSATFV